MTVLGKPLGLALLLAGLAAAQQPPPEGMTIYETRCVLCHGGDGGGTISMKQRKAMVARRFITHNRPRIAAMAERIFGGDKSTFREYEILAGPVPQEV